MCIVHVCFHRKSRRPLKVSKSAFAPCDTKTLCSKLLLIKLPSGMQLNIIGQYLIFNALRQLVCVCEMQGLVCWFHNTVWLLNISNHIIASKKLVSSFSFPSPLINPFQFPFSLDFLIFHLSATVISILSFNSCSEVSFFFYKTPFLLSLFRCSGDDPHMHKDLYTHAWKWSEMKIYCILHMLCFSIEAIEAIEA